MTMRTNEQEPIQSGSNGASGTEQREYQFGGDFVVTSSRASGAWIAAEHPMLAVDQIDTEGA